MSEEDIEQIEMIIEINETNVSEAHKQQYIKLLYDYYKSTVNKPKLHKRNAIGCVASLMGWASIILSFVWFDWKFAIVLILGIYSNTIAIALYFKEKQKNKEHH